MYWDLSYWPTYVIFWWLNRVHLRMCIVWFLIKCFIHVNWPITLMLLFKYFISLLIFNLLILLGTKRGVLISNCNCAFFYFSFEFFQFLLYIFWSSVICIYKITCVLLDYLGLLYILEELSFYHHEIHFFTHCNNPCLEVYIDWFSLAAQALFWLFAICMFSMLFKKSTGVFILRQICWTQPIVASCFFIPTNNHWLLILEFKQLTFSVFTDTFELDLTIYSFFKSVLYVPYLFLLFLSSFRSVHYFWSSTDLLAILLCFIFWSVF